MDALLPAIKAALIAGGYKTEITTDIDRLPEELQLPCLCIADAGTEAIREGLNETTTVLSVKIAAYYDATMTPEKATIGAGDKEGVLTLAKGVHAVLDDNLLALADYEDAWPEAADAPVHLWGNEQKIYVRTVITMVYRRVDT